ncbi:RnaseH-domain-containing protein [Xylariaceae sp. FL1019]|nr:RnaseH-domain-containing protein [Xylariaceae sp. FL1019]
MPATTRPRKSKPATATSSEQPSGTPSTITTKPSKKRKMDPNTKKYYAVRAGKVPGVYEDWNECQEQISGFRGASFKAFADKDDAEAFVAGMKTSVTAEGEARFYGIAVGRQPGVYTDWDEASQAIKGWKGPKYKKFSTREEAIEFIRANGNEEAQQWLQDEGEVSIEPPKKKKKTSGKTDPKVDTLAFAEEPDVEQVFTDGACTRNGQKGACAGVGVYWGENDERNVSEPLKGDIQTNQRAELTAILRALEAAEDDVTIRIFSDSRYAIDCVNSWYKNWEKNGWKTSSGTEVTNPDVIKAARAKIDERKALGADTLFQWVKGHDKNVGNIAADALAVKGAAMLRKR